MEASSEANRLILKDFLNNPNDGYFGKVFEYLSPKDLISASGVSQEWKKLADPYFKKLTEKKITIEKKDPENTQLEKTPVSTKVSKEALFVLLGNLGTGFNQRLDNFERKGRVTREEKKGLEERFNQTKELVISVAEENSSLEKSLAISIEESKILEEDIASLEKDQETLKKEIQEYLDQINLLSKDKEQFQQHITGLKEGLIALLESNILYVSKMEKLNADLIKCKQDNKIIQDEECQTIDRLRHEVFTSRITNEIKTGSFNKALQVAGIGLASFGVGRSIFNIGKGFIHDIKCAVFLLPIVLKDFMLSNCSSSRYISRLISDVKECEGMGPILSVIGTVIALYGLNAEIKEKLKKDSLLIQAEARYQTYTKDHPKATVEEVLNYVRPLLKN